LQAGAVTALVTLASLPAVRPAEAAQEVLPASRLVDAFRFTAAGDEAVFTFVQAGGEDGEVVTLLDHRGVQATAPLGPELDDGRGVAQLRVATLEPGVQRVKVCSDTTCSNTVHIVFDGPVDGVIAALLGRRATPAELTALAGRPIDDVASLVAAGDERTAGVVRELYHVHLGREPDPAGLQHWVTMLEAGTSPEAAAAALCGTEPRPSRPGPRPGRCWPIEEALAPDTPVDEQPLGSSFAEVAHTDGAHEWVVRRVFGTLLGREPERGAVAYWSSTVDGTVASDALLVGVLGSDEYFEHAG
jgi:hypothetical protein